MILGGESVGRNKYPSPRAATNAMAARAAIFRRERLATDVTGAIVAAAVPLAGVTKTDGAEPDAPPMVHGVAEVAATGVPVLLTEGPGSTAATAGLRLESVSLFLQALAYVFVRVNESAFNTFLVFFGLWLLLIGFLIFRSTFLPRVLGVLVAISGLGWSMYLVPPHASHLFMPYLAGASGLGEIPLLLWFLVVGVNPQRWKEQACAAGRHRL
jgi:Domain of unknown function (DUF4386)